MALLTAEQYTQLHAMIDSKGFQAVLIGLRMDAERKMDKAQKELDEAEAADYDDDDDAEHCINEAEESLDFWSGVVGSFSDLETELQGR